MQKTILLRKKMVAIGLLGFHIFGNFMRNKILGIFPKFQGKKSP